MVWYTYYTVYTPVPRPHPQPAHLIDIISTCTFCGILVVMTVVFGRVNLQNSRNANMPKSQSSIKCKVVKHINGPTRILSGSYTV